MILDNLTALTIYEVETLQDIFILALKEQENILLDMAKIDKIDIVGIQLLLSMVSTVKASQKTIKLINVKDTVLQQIKISNTQIALGLDV
ncbi:STAS domain-containing protein [Sulfurimonas sp.]|jgi:ABC-type transporter Mla MlaB component|uniref:STAS domain-containing protein n=1 Tax=Sulfurimonas sp. TaxID=2022749 RepID=UPI0025E1C0ED|nr:STAS domain-containing protein [Sulfurimonas sp.]MBT5933741.1 STAS domain-containing protein [Sulfurimonas sp.]